MAKSPQLTPQTMRVLSTLYHASGASGAEVCRETGLPSGTVYPILTRLEEAGWLHSNWEIGDPAVLGRPRRRYYTLTAEGVQKAFQGAKATAEIYVAFAR